MDFGIIPCVNKIGWITLADINGSGKQRTTKNMLNVCNFFLEIFPSWTQRSYDRSIDSNLFKTQANIVESDNFERLTVKSQVYKMLRFFLLTWIYSQENFNTVTHMLFWHPRRILFMKTLWEMEKLLTTSHFSFSHNIFYLIW